LECEDAMVEELAGVVFRVADVSAKSRSGVSPRAKLAALEFWVQDIESMERRNSGRLDFIRWALGRYFIDFRKGHNG
jgi:hypothetical protein